MKDKIKSDNPATNAISLDGWSENHEDRFNYLQFKFFIAFFASKLNTSFGVVSNDGFEKIIYVQTYNKRLSKKGVQKGWILCPENIKLWLQILPVT